MAAMTPEQIATFRAIYPEFSDVLLYPDARLQMQWTLAGCYISDRGCNCAGPDGTDCREQMLYLMLAHLLALSTMVSAGTGAPAVVSSARVDKVAVTLVPPPVTDAWDWWLNTTPYGAQLLALLSVCSVGGFYAGGLPEPRAIRKYGGIF